MNALHLPDGLTQRPLTLTDAHAVFEVMAAQELHDIGAVEIDESDIVGDWQRPSFDIGASTVGVFDGGRLVAYGEYSGGDRADAAVHPDVRGRGIGTAVAGWIQQTALAAGAERVGMQVPQDSDADRLLEHLGYRLRWTAWDFTLPEGREIDTQPLPGGYALRDAGEAERETVWTVIEDAFLEWSDRDRHPLEDFAAQVWLRPGFEPWNLRVLTDPAGTIAGATFVVMAGQTGYISRIAVRRDQRGKGLARAMLVDAFGLARAHGATTSVLSTDSRTGARGVYERVGMEVTSTWVNRAMEL